MENNQFKHVPILLDEVIKNIITNKDGTYVDGTLGGGGHSEKILENLSNKGRLIGIDRDIDAINASKSRLNKYGVGFRGINGNYKQVEGYLEELGINLVDGILIDLGISSYQIDTAHRGFSYNHDAKLDMRMNQKDSLNAYDVINKYSQNDLYRVIRNYGEEKFARQISLKIDEARKSAPVETTFQLVEIIKSAIPAPARRKGGHPAKRTFQAIRIEVNEELEGLRETLETMIRLLKSGGRLCVISFHSLEDRIVKSVMREAENPCTCPSDVPFCICGKIGLGKSIPRKGIVASPDEIDINPRSKSARLRIFIKK